MKKRIFKILVVVLLVMEVSFLCLIFKSFSKNNKEINKVSYNNRESIKPKKMLAFYKDDGNGYVEDSSRDSWPGDDYAFAKARCLDNNNLIVPTYDVLDFDNVNHKATITTDKTVYCSLYFASITTPVGALLKNSGSTLETEKALAARNETIGNIKDDLRRFVGKSSEVKNNFICFGTNNQKECIDNTDTYMYRIIGIDTQGRLKLIKATKVRKDSSNAFYWSRNGNYWNDSDLYKGLNGKSPDSSKSYLCNQCFGIGSEYKYMESTKWTNLISPTIYYIGRSTSTSNPTLFNNERSKALTDGDNIGIMYLSDYLYAYSQSTENWLYISNGLNGNVNTPPGSDAPKAEMEWTLTNSSGSGAWVVNWYNGGLVNEATYNEGAVRPVFYLIPNIEITGNGDIETPYIISLE